MFESVSIKIGENELILETGKMAKQANGSIFAKMGGSAVLVTVCCSSTAVEGLDFVPLQVEYNEKYYAAGKIPGGFLKREGRPKDKEILVSRLIDRPMRPLFSKKFGREIQIVPTAVSSDQINPTDTIAMVASSAAVAISDIPFDGPVGAVRVAYVGDRYVINPTFEEIAASKLDIVVAGSLDGITMVEGGAKEVSEELMLGAIDRAREEIVNICNGINKLVALCGKKKLPLVGQELSLPNQDEIIRAATPLLQEACFVKGKFNRRDAINSVIVKIKEEFLQEPDELSEKLFANLMDDLERTIVRDSILNKGLRTDGRGVEDIRPITCEIGLLQRTHGSSLFTRGETQSMGVVTLGTAEDERIVDDIDGEKSTERFMLHYNFPPFSVGETGRLTTGRREIGHGHLAQRALESMLPSNEEFPYTIRVVSEILESNGSSSMATVCSGTLALLDAGVPMKKPVAGIAMGLISQGDKVVVLSDILGEEDHLGDMDFKVTGTSEGITAFQMDIKINGVTTQIMTKALEQARRGRMHILGIMNQTISEPRATLSDYAPKITSYKIDEDKIGAVIGTGGKTIKSICEKSQSVVNIEQDGTVKIFSKNSQSAQIALDMIKSLVEDPEIGRIYNGVVKRIMDFGAFIEIVPGKEGLCHISKLSQKRVQNVTDVLKEGQEIPVKLIEIDKMGRLNLSYIDALKEQEEQSGDSH